MNTDIFQINLFDWFAIWGAILVVLLLLMWFSRERAADRDDEELQRQSRRSERFSTRLPEDKECPNGCH